MININTAVKTRYGTRDNPCWAYGIITDITIEDGYPLYKIEYDEGGYDSMYDFEFELA